MLASTTFGFWEVFSTTDASTFRQIELALKFGVHHHSPLVFPMHTPG
jgi:hypothetical protein